MGNTKPELHAIKAALIVALQTPAGDPAQAIWWDGTVTYEGKSLVVLQVWPEIAATVTNVLEAYTLTPGMVVSGSSYHLLAIMADKLAPIPPITTVRDWTPDGDHAEWKASVVRQLDALGITRIKMEFSGSGDSGNPDEFSAPRNGDTPYYAKDYGDTRQSEFAKLQERAVPEALEKEISEYVWERLVQHDVVNNEGGGGDLTIILPNPDAGDPEFLFSIFTNETIQHQHESEMPV